MKEDTSAQAVAYEVDALALAIEEAHLDRVVTDADIRRIDYHIGLLKLRAEGHAVRVKLGMRLINGGVCDRELQANVRSYGRWSKEQKECLNRLASVEASEIQAA